MCALRLRSIQRAVFLSCFLIGTAPAQAESDLQKFVATVPPQVAFEFSMYNTCAIVASLKKKKDASFQEKEMAIANECKKYITQAERDLAQARFPADQRAKIIERFSFLASTERRLRAEGKAIPGYQASPETTELMECLHKLDAAKAVYSTCVDEALRNLIPLSTDTSDVVADAALGMCAVKRNEMRNLDGNLGDARRRRGELRPDSGLRVCRDIIHTLTAEANTVGIRYCKVFLFRHGVDQMNARHVPGAVVSVAVENTRVQLAGRVVDQRELERDRVPRAARERVHHDLRPGFIAVTAREARVRTCRRSGRCALGLRRGYRRLRRGHRRLRRGRLRDGRRRTLRVALLALRTAADRSRKQRERGNSKDEVALRYHRFSPCFFSSW